MFSVSSASEALWAPPLMLCCQWLTGEDVGVSVFGSVDGQVSSIMGKIQTDTLQLLKKTFCQNLCF